MGQRGDGRDDGAAPRLQDQAPAVLHGYPVPSFSSKYRMPDRVSMYFAGVVTAEKMPASTAHAGGLGSRAATARAQTALRAMDGTAVRPAFMVRREGRQEK